MSDQPGEQADPQTHPATSEEDAPEIVSGENDVGEKPRFDVEHGEVESEQEIRDDPDREDVPLEPPGSV